MKHQAARMGDIKFKAGLRLSRRKQWLAILSLDELHFVGSNIQVPRQKRS